MGSSKVTDYMIAYMKTRKLCVPRVAEQAGIPVEKLQENYAEPLMAEEFLSLCVVLGITPEEIRKHIKE